MKATTQILVLVVGLLVSVGPRVSGLPLVRGPRHNPAIQQYRFHSRALSLSENDDENRISFLTNRKSWIRNAGVSIGTLWGGLQAFAHWKVWTNQLPPPEPFLENPNFEKKDWWKTVETLTIVFHGAGGPDQYTKNLMQKLASSSSPPNTVAHFVDWSEYSSNLLQASWNGQALGKSMGNFLARQSPRLVRVHVIGISVGAFAANEFCRQLRLQQGDRKSYIQLTLLDPFCQRGLLDVNYGYQNYGQEADYAQQFYNTDDPVPSTNAPLSRHMVCWDVTASSRRPSDLFGHDWPLVYFAEYRDLGFIPPDRQYPVGTVLQVKD